MIKITLVRDVQGHLTQFTVSGHAYYDDPGKDIVCAGVSAVSIGAVNAIEKLTGLVPHTEITEQSGLLKVIAPNSEDEGRNAQVQLLLEGMVVALESIAQEYGKFVKIKHTFSGKGG
ncbi:MAG: ribosomal-processing cysteine protease Prp [Candidatus Cohnella colombiensis]|uniref:Ribosomal processing cysteine protease Prp n=1 Tax=Candidatus Cohnella colombiensis TaxID=3121368 RepID=A0AA95EYI8_9BACL|nr:MAG: ribosomal-processing cysteine protease Prp [Cohnella sp.]